ncbi:hypothetical protein GCM10023195_77280 [Actinoallomurus liliacearum]|uniref:Uncharacterized protein n=1 Tax=Actinoallomurus liliacearum TaxID=1080073 RepID=A0ABP8TYF3_9ACTN
MATNSNNNTGSDQQQSRPSQGQSGPSEERSDAPWDKPQK